MSSGFSSLFRLTRSRSKQQQAADAAMSVTGDNSEKAAAEDAPRLDLFNQLPIDLSLSILSYLSVSSVCLCSRLSSLMFLLSQDDQLWLPLLIQRFKDQQNKLDILTEEEWIQYTGDNEDMDESHPESLSIEAAPLCWKARYVSAEVDLCRSYLTVEEVSSLSWKFRFHPNILFRSSETIFPRFTADYVYTHTRPETAMPWTFIEGERTTTTQAETELTPLTERSTRLWERHRRSREQQRSSSSLCPHSAAASDRANMTELERRGFISSQNYHQLRQHWEQQQRSGVQCTVPIRVTTLPESFPSVPGLPATRYPIGHPWIQLRPEGLADLFVTRQLQVDHYPPLTMSRTANGGWQLINQHVILTSITADEEEGNTSEEVDPDSEVEHEDNDNNRMILLWLTEEQDEDLHHGDH